MEAERIEKSDEDFQRNQSSFAYNEDKRKWKNKFSPVLLLTLNAMHTFEFRQQSTV
jgi:hypothetical protein